MGAIMQLTKYTDLTRKDIISLMDEWARLDYGMNVRFVPGSSKTIKGSSYWLAKSFPGEGCYFDKVVASPDSLIS